MFTEVYITVGSMEEGQKIAHKLVSDRLVACVNMFPINSIYSWEGEVVEDQEFALLAKTTADKFDEVKETVRSIHSYDLPCIVSWELGGESEYLGWVRNYIHED
ncbi:CutA1 divalent ion tolerance protein [Methanosalsum zhilinae DSM 4017]|uniref:CutA1 divalent ion tolerance protein n=1 Tax=Methanosalsum zhilinae (strain DSM 4017 / NBRC 107636 / OCM 62 / WeN5) TaxID=679901 RepID=F7XPQ1_METZD|nr:divalent-cation tolerance protein CutA [Methanosalsum zhilinae]AEH60321.1 CutA1 divalent ion tolerance protein [Methanosalsum zhilinae DSM 4017]